ncbi:DUF3466 family protein [Colwellia sp. E2M01]|uniref:DUF3466 family protein n=1 Tax=Colwellia sp. E2M01 TaxID=2841561 RepID=UPI001C086E9B|nr:DUF3466 family protein [Colwellia sp. E2M01]MBU2869757.1 DUF3466 family protein [Colwellia sp. E2M01]
MKSFAKNILTLGVTSALSVSISLFNFSHAATYRVIDKNAAENLGYTYGGKLNNQGNMSISGASFYNFPVQFEYLTDEDFNNILSLSIAQSSVYFGLTIIEDFDALKSGNPTANDLAWAEIYLEDRNQNVSNYQYQIVAEAAGLINLGTGSESTEICIFDTNFEGTPCTGTLTRSTYNTVEGFNNSGTVFGTATAPYLPIAGPDDGENVEVQSYWVREHGQRGFYSPDFGATIYPVPPIETAYGGGVSAVLDVNDNNIAVGYSSYELSSFWESVVLSETNVDGVLGCANPEVLALMPYEICVQNKESGMYYIQAFEAVLSSTGIVETKGLGLLVNPHEDDTRAFSSQALAINNNGVAVGYAHGWDEGNVHQPAVDERMTGSYAVMFKDGKVLDFNQEHYYFTLGSVFDFSRANDINDNGLVVGYTHTANTFVKKFFYVDTNVSESRMEMIIPRGFFDSSKSTAFGVNSAGVIVGEAEIEPHNDAIPRRTAGFMYDTSDNSPEMIDLNTLLECESGYNIFQAKDINESGQISASAITQSPYFDALGNEVLDSSGNPFMIDVVRAVLLDPIPGGEVEDCSKYEDKVERQGASFGGFLLLTLASIFGFRRVKSIN